ncbi:hypothetical protein LZC95_40890 [Pendulispora brunnea]|uniref:HTH marR-type domain-containing protein n=1 Tax=Pendulispora brunnea TaxID=2905690 RepID=A0ABZ2K239_9BACT
MGLHLKPQDVVLALKAVATGRRNWTQTELAQAVFVSPSECNEGLKRLAACHLFDRGENRIIRANLLEFLVHGLRYVFPARLGDYRSGVPTGFALRDLADAAGVMVADDEDRVVWPLADGEIGAAFGRAIEPLYKTVPRAAEHDPEFHEYLALIDMVRIGRSHESPAACKELEMRLINEEKQRASLFS